MGIVVKQSFLNVLMSYLGVVIGFINVTILRPLILTTGQIGLVEILNSYANILANVFQLGFIQVLTILFPKYKDDKNYGGLFLGGMVVSVFGTILAAVLIYFITPLLGSEGTAESPLLSYFWLLIPWVFFNMMFGIMDTFFRLTYNSTIGVILRELVMRLSIMLVLLLLLAKLYDYDTFVFLYGFSFYLPGIIFFILFISRNNLEKLVSKPLFGFIKNERKEVLSISLWGILGTLGFMLTVQIDKIMIEQVKGLEFVGIYSTLLPYAVLILIPSRAMKRITTTIITRSWEANDLDTIKDVYRKSSINQFILGTGTFILVWASLPHILTISGKSYENHTLVVFWIGIAYLTDMIMGVNAEIISTSKKYRYNTYFILLLAVFNVISNIFFIDIYGIEGAAFATFLSMLAVNLIRYFFLKKTYGFLLFDKKTFLAIIFFMVFFAMAHYLPDTGNNLVNVVYKSSLIGGLYGIVIYKSKLSIDLNDKVEGIVSKFGINLK